MEAVTITLPAIDETVIATISQLNTQAVATETEAFKAIRENYSALAKQNGFVKIGWTYRGDGSNWREEKNYYYKRDGKRLKALLCSDNFTQTFLDQNRGRRVGDKLYLLETDEWLRIEQDGNWSAWQGAAESWACGDGIIDANEYDAYDDSRNEGSIRLLTDAEVAAEYQLADVVKGLGESLNTLATKLPERMVRAQRRVSLAAQLLEALK